MTSNVIAIPTPIAAYFEDSFGPATLDYYGCIFIRVQLCGSYLLWIITYWVRIECIELSVGGVFASSDLLSPSVHRFECAVAVQTQDEVKLFSYRSSHTLPKTKL